MKYPFPTLLFSLSLLFAPALAAELDALQEQAQAGDAIAQTELGYRYHTGEGVERDFDRAIHWYRQAAAQGQPDAQYNLGVAHAFGEGLEPDPARAAEWYQQAAEQGHSVAAFSLGLAHLHGEGVGQDAWQAAIWFQQAAERGYTRAQVHLASLYHTGDGIPQDFEKAVYWYREAAIRDNATAQYNLAQLYRAGRGVGKDNEQARRWLQAAAEQGYGPAQAELAALQRPADGDTAAVAPGDAQMTDEAATQPASTPEPVDTSDPAVAGEAAGDESPASAGNDKRPGFWARLFGGDEAGDTEQADTVATLPDVPPVATEPEADDAPAVSGSQATDTDAEATADEGYLAAIEPAENALAQGAYREAVELLQAAALAGNPAAETRLGELHAEGLGVSRSDGHALLWYRRAAGRDYAAAQYHLGNMYLHGKGVIPDKLKARDWFSRAADQGHTGATEQLRELEQVLAERRRFQPESREQAQQAPDDTAPAADGGPAAPSAREAIDSQTSGLRAGRIVTPPIEELPAETVELETTPATLDAPADTGTDSPAADERPARRVVSPPLEPLDD